MYSTIQDDSNLRTDKRTSNKIQLNPYNHISFTRLGKRERKDIESLLRVNRGDTDDFGIRNCVKWRELRLIERGLI